ncbi:hypothetical protein CGCF413_v000859 [Colletotrichum fructicola]|nr:hypothetical protein CGCF413_v000859 [Colletotrichum fructicola]
MARRRAILERIAPSGLPQKRAISLEQLVSSNHLLARPVTTHLTLSLSRKHIAHLDHSAESLQQPSSSITRRLDSRPSR